MVGQDWDQVQDILVAASKAEESGFSATQAALQNLLRCTVCPFQDGCVTKECPLVSNDGQTGATAHVPVHTATHGFAEARRSFRHKVQVPVDAVCPRAQGACGIGRTPQYAAAL